MAVVVERNIHLAGISVRVFVCSWYSTRKRQDSTEAEAEAEAEPTTRLGPRERLCKTAE